MTDEDINARVAEIEGWSKARGVSGLTHWTPPGMSPASNMMGGCKSSPPPYAASWALCGPLIEKYKLDLHLLDEDPDHWEAWHGGAVGSGPQLKRAICLAVIAMHNDES